MRRAATRHCSRTHLTACAAGTPSGRARRRSERMAAAWFSAIDVDGSGAITLAEFKSWYLATMQDAEELGVA